MAKRFIFTFLIALIYIAFPVIAQKLNTNETETQPASMESTSWVDENTGEWLISFFPSFAIYDAKAWEYKDKDFSKGKFLITDGTHDINVTVENEKNSQRKILLDRNKKTIISPITGLYNTAYLPDTSFNAFIDNGYQEGDSVIINGWLKDMPQDAKDKGYIISFRKLRKMLWKNILMLTVILHIYSSTLMALPSSTLMQIHAI